MSSWTLRVGVAAQRNYRATVQFRLHRNMTIGRWSPIVEVFLFPPDAVRGGKPPKSIPFKEALSWVFPFLQA